MPSFSALAAARPQRQASPPAFIADPLPGGSDSGDAVFVSDDDREAFGADGRALATPNLEQQLAQAREEGQAVGRSELPWQEADALREATAVLEEAARGIVELRRRYLREQRTTLVEIALAVAEKLIRRQVEADPDVLAEVVKDCLATLDADASEDADPVAVLRLAPAQLELLERGLAPELARISSEAGLALEADRTLEVGDIRIQSTRWHVDARLPELLDRTRRALAEVLDVGEGSP